MDQVVVGAFGLAALLCAYCEHLVEAGELGAAVLRAGQLVEELGRVVVREEGLARG